jgi:hypothetical protein
MSDDLMVEVCLRAKNAAAEREDPTSPSTQTNAAFRSSFVGQAARPSGAGQWFRTLKSMCMHSAPKDRCRRSRRFQ